MEQMRNRAEGGGGGISYVEVNEVELLPGDEYLVGAVGRYFTLIVVVVGSDDGWVKRGFGSPCKVGF